MSSSPRNLRVPSASRAVVRRIARGRLTGQPRERQAFVDVGANDGALDLAIFVLAIHHPARALNGIARLILVIAVGQLDLAFPVPRQAPGGLPMFFRAVQLEDEDGEAESGAGEPERLAGDGQPPVERVCHVRGKVAGERHGTYAHGRDKAVDGPEEEHERRGCAGRVVVDVDEPDECDLDTEIEGIVDG